VKCQGNWCCKHKVLHAPRSRGQEHEGRGGLKWSVTAQASIEHDSDSWARARSAACTLAGSVLAGVVTVTGKGGKPPSSRLGSDNFVLFGGCAAVTLASVASSL
jgi:hypothetical protein